MMLYPLLAALGVLQLLNPYSLSLIASQSLGRWMLVGVAALLSLAAACALTSTVINHGDGGLDPAGIPVLGFSDALLHFSLSVVYVEFAVGEYLLAPANRALIIGILGLLLIGTGSCLGLRPLGPGRGFRRDITRRDHTVRGLVLSVMGALLFSAAVISSSVPLAQSPYAPAFVLVIIAALLLYGFHALWISGKASDIPMVQE